MIALFLANWKIMFGVIFVLALASAAGYIAILRAENVSAEMRASASAKLAADTAEALSEYETHAKLAQAALSAELADAQSRASDTARIKVKIKNVPVSTSCATSHAIGALIGSLRDASTIRPAGNTAPNP